MAWVKLRLINDAPEFSDQLVYQKHGGKSGCIDCCESVPVNLFGAVDTSIYCINDGNMPYTIYYSVNGGAYFGTKTVVTVPFDTTELLVVY